MPIPALLEDGLFDDESAVVWPSSAGSPPTGQPFLSNVFGPEARMLLKVAWRADVSADISTWSFADITADVMQSPGVSVTAGGADGQSQATQATMTWSVLNTSGDYTQRRPASQYWPYVKFGPPVEFDVNIGGGLVEQFTGFIESIKPGWDKSGKVPVVAFSATGILGRLSQGKAPLRSSIYRRIITGQPRPALYWPTDDGADATQAGSALGGSAFRFAGTGAAVLFGVDGPVGGSAAIDVTALVSATAIPQINPIIPAINTGLVGDSYTVAFWVKGGASSTTWSTPVLSLETTSTVVPRWTVSLGDPDSGSTLILSPERNDGTVSAIFILSHTDPLDGGWHLCWFSLQQISATQVTVAGGIDKLAQGFTSSTFEIGKLTGIRIGHTPATDAASNVVELLLSNLAVWNSATVPYLDLYNAGTGWASESATDRLLRLCEEESIRCFVTGSSNVAMGPQGTDPFLTVTREPEAADHGNLYDGSGFALVYRARAARYNAPVTLAINASDLAEAPQPVEDNQKTQNDVTVSRKNGSNARYVVPEGRPYAPTGDGGIGTYDTSETINTQTDVVLYNHASWLAHLGTVDEDRYPNLVLDFAARPNLAPAWLASGGVGARITVANMPAEASPVTPDVFVEGFTATYSMTDWTVELNCSPARPHDVAVLGTARVQTAGSALHDGVAPGATSLSVDVTRRLWTTDPSRFPIDLSVGGLRVTCTGISGVASPQTFSIDSSTLTQALGAGVAVKLWTPAIIAL